MRNQILATALTTALCVAAVPQMSAAQTQLSVPAGAPVAAAATQVVVAVGKSTTISVPAPYTDVLVAEPRIADVTPVDTHSVSVVGKAMGSTVITLYGANKTLLATVNVVVSADLEGLKAQLHQICRPKRVSQSVPPISPSCCPGP